MGDYYCTNCGADLEEQDGFDPNNDYWTCEECGQFLTNPSNDDEQRFENVSWFCDECGAYLNKQFGFSDWNDTWKCTECGYVNNISEDEIQEKRKEYDDDEYDDDENDDNDDDVIRDKNGTKNLKWYMNRELDEEFIEKKIFEKQVQKEEFHRQAQINQAKKDRRKALGKRIWSTIVRGKRIDVNVSSEECKGENYLKVISWFEKNGFLNIKTNIIEDLEYCELDKDNIVSEVRINGNNYFEYTTQAKYDAEIMVTFHGLKKVVPPFNVKEAKKLKGEVLIRSFKYVGFVNVKSNVIEDLVLGWFKKNGEVSSVTIDGNERYKADIAYRIDTPIVITYHTFKNQRKY